ncbi:MAG TPA: sigma factor-like helix-turn-helix DNA-binding protein [Candidatus Acidoferrales bacterium]|nr:sigma factor-like helix-turn-helix DNA-binding protein [Candidatus Acidoferrales bacterium]
MNVHVSYKAGKTPEVEREFQIHIHKLERRLQAFNPDLVHFHAIVDQQNGQGPSTSLNLRLPSGQLAVQKSGDTLVAAIKTAFSDLTSQLKKHMDMLRGDWSRKRRQTGRGQVIEPTVPFEQTLASVPPQDRATDGAPPNEGNDLETWFNANLPALKQFIENELSYRTNSGQLREDQVSPEEVLDEVMLSALSDGGTGSRFLSEESWFQGLALQAIRRLLEANADSADVSLDVPARSQNVSGSDENILQYHQPDDQPQGEGVLRDSHVRTPEEIFLNEELVAQLDIVLHELSAPDREAFVLYTLEGFTIDEISRLSDRPPDQVRKSIEKARDRVQKHLPEQNDFRGRLLKRSRVA